MQTKSLEILLQEANDEIKRLSFSEAQELIESNESVIIDVREESEVNSLGIIQGSIHIPRGLIEFKLNPNSPNNVKNISDQTNLLIYCAGGYRSALAAKSLKEIGFKNVFNLGGFDEWIDNGGKVTTSK
tara:strand:- start:207 stop:593 length:387 start_codon:yes stop_codon:yes gene_type:complete